MVNLAPNDRGLYCSCTGSTWKDMRWNWWDSILDQPIQILQPRRSAAEGFFECSQDSGDTLVSDRWATQRGADSFAGMYHARVFLTALMIFTTFARALSLSLASFPCHPPSRSQSLFFSISHSLSLSPSLSFNLTLTQSHSLTLPQSHTPSRSL